MHGQLAIEDNIRRLASEKQLIHETHNTLVQMTKEVQSSLENSAKMIADQRSNTKVNHAQLLDDVNTIQKKAGALFDRIGKLFWAGKDGIQCALGMEFIFDWKHTEIEDLLIDWLRC